jgi:hypothetical protein
MRDERDNRLDELFDLARREAPDTTRLEEHFETRLMARLVERRTGVTSPWQRLVWRMVPAFAAITALLLICSLAMNPARSGDPFAAITSGYDDQVARNYLLGDTK